VAVKRNVGLYFKVTSQEKELIHKKMALLDIRNFGAYLRKMAIDGYILNLDIKSLKELLSLMRTSANNINQIARRANETRSLYAEDMEDLKQCYDNLWAAVGAVASELSTLKR